VAGGIVEKLVRRHPHVFADVIAADAAAVEANWETIKAAEKQRTSVLEGIPLALPALALADKVVGRAEKILPAHAGVPAPDLPAHPDVPVPADPPAHADLPASGDLEGTPAATPVSPSGEDARLGEALLDLVRQARAAGVDPEQALRTATHRLADQVREAESDNT
jgi:XTP/dITP diphosphohydrolase